MNHKKQSEQQLLDAFFAGDDSAMSILVERHRKRVCDYINMMVKNREVSDDICQETFIKVLRFLREGRYIDSGRFLSWVMRIAHNQVIDHFRQHKQQGHVSETNAGYDIFNNHKLSDTNIEDQMIQTQIQEDVRRLVDMLPDEQREVVMMRYFNGLSFKEIAEQTDVSINTALGRMRYALMNLRKMISEKQMILN